MTKRERVMAALRGDETDRVPPSFWPHNFAAENTPRRPRPSSTRWASPCVAHDAGERRREELMAPLAAGRTPVRHGGPT